MRPIDSDALIQELENSADYCKQHEQEADEFVFRLMISLLKDETVAPTLTLPNEWVCVDERLPEEKCRVLVRVTGSDTLDIDTDRLVKGKWVRWHGHVIHWMPCLLYTSRCV